MPTLRSREDFARIGAEGRSRANRLMAVRFVPNGRDYDRYGISTGRRIGGAVQRNRVRRRLREILRRSPNENEHGLDIIIVVRGPAVDVTFDELRGSLERLLRTAHGSMKAAL